MQRKILQWSRQGDEEQMEGFVPHTFRLEWRHFCPCMHMPNTTGIFLPIFDASVVFIQPANGEGMDYHNRSKWTRQGIAQRTWLGNCGNARGNQLVESRLDRSRNLQRDPSTTKKDKRFSRQLISYRVRGRGDLAPLMFHTRGPLSLLWAHSKILPRHPS